MSSHTYVGFDQCVESRGFWYSLFSVDSYKRQARSRFETDNNMIVFFSTAESFGVSSQTSFGASCFFSTRGDIKQTCQLRKSLHLVGVLEFMNLVVGVSWQNTHLLRDFAEWPPMTAMA